MIQRGKRQKLFSRKVCPKSALEVVNRIYTEAKTNKQEAQQVKALVYQSQLITQWVKIPGKKTLLRLKKNLRSN
jgi:hypothetical protein